MKKGLPYPPPTYQRQDEEATKNLYAYLDIAGYNYYEDKYEILHQIHLERVLLGTETRGNLIEETMRFAKQHPYLIGTPLPELHRFRLLWGQETGLFLSAQPPIHEGHPPLYNSYKWTDSVKGWTFQGYEGKETFIDAHTDAATVEVWINGKSLGRQAVREHFVRFPCVYQPGEVTAAAYSETGEELYCAHLHTAGEETCILVVSDRNVLRAGGEDFAFVNISITDPQSNPKLLPERTVSIKTEGAAFYRVLAVQTRAMRKNSIIHAGPLILGSFWQYSAAA